MTETTNMKILFGILQGEMTESLRGIKKAISHPVSKGNETELCWLTMLEKFLPKRYAVDKAFVLDSDGRLSEEIDIVVYDRHFSPFLFRKGQLRYVPAESVYAVFEVKPNLNLSNIKYAAGKIASVRELKRTTVQIPHAGGTYAPKEPFWILGGILTLGSTWKEAFGVEFTNALSDLSRISRIDLGCILEKGGFQLCGSNHDFLEVSSDQDSLIYFFLTLLFRLQEVGSPSAMDIGAYAKVLNVSKRLMI